MDVTLLELDQLGINVDPMVLIDLQAEELPITLSRWFVSAVYALTRAFQLLGNGGVDIESKPFAKPANG